MEFIELQSDDLLKDKFKEMSLLHLYATLNDGTFPRLKYLALMVFVLFGSTFLCEQAFSRMKLIKNKLRSVLTDEHISQLMSIATSAREPNFDKLMKMQNQLSH